MILLLNYINWFSIQFSTYHSNIWMFTRNKINILILSQSYTENIIIRKNKPSKKAPSKDLRRIKLLIYVWFLICKLACAYHPQAYCLHINSMPMNPLIISLLEARKLQLVMLQIIFHRCQSKLQVKKNNLWSSTRILKICNLYSHLSASPFEVMDFIEKKISFYYLHWQIYPQDRKLG